MGRISHYSYIFSRIFCWIIIYLCCNIQASTVNYILHNIEENALEISDLQSLNVSVTFEGGQWVAILTCEFQYQITADVSWHANKTGKRIGTDNPSSKAIVTNLIVSDGTIQSTLTINNFTYDDVDQYTCLLAEPKGYSSRTLWVAPKPIVDYDSPGIVVEGKNISVSVPCNSFPGAQLFFRLPCIDDVDTCYQDWQFENSTQNPGVNETITFSFTSKLNDGSDYFQCCMKMPSNQQPHQCTVFPIYVEGGVVGLGNGGTTVCSSSESKSKCSFGGIFWSYPFLDNTSISWTFNDGIAPEKYNVYPRGYTILSFIDVEINSKNYTLTATNEKNDSCSYDFYAEAGQFMPLLNTKPFSKLTDNHGSFSANFTCMFTASPDPEIYWYKSSLNGISSTIMTEIDSTPEHTIFNTFYPGVKQKKTVLQISKYQNFDKDIFICVAVNKNGMLSSFPLAAYSQINDFQLNINVTSVSGSNPIVANCSARGYPPPTINWKIIAEFDVVYTIDYTPDYDLGATISLATIMDQGENSFIDIECIAFTEFEPKLRKRAKRTIDIYHDTALTDFTQCTPDEFAEGSQCTMTCSFQSNNESAMTHWDWSYYVKDPGETLNTPFAIVDDGKNIQPLTPYKTQVSLTMSGYNAGWYRCWALYQNTSAQASKEIVYHNFQINTASGLNIGDPCTESAQCISLYATCFEDICQCSGANSIPLDNRTNTLKCLKPANPGEPCLTNAQCEAGKTNFICTNTTTGSNLVCTCNGSLQNVEEEGGEQMCLHEADYKESCHYNEECKISDVNLLCNSKCECVDDYKHDDFLGHCVYKSSGHLSGTAVLVILIAVLLAGALIAYVVVGVIKRRRQQSSTSMSSGIALASRNAPANSYGSTGDDDLPYSEFANSSLEIDGASINSENA